MSSARFAVRLQEIMIERDLTQSDLARMIWGTMMDERGYEVAKNRQLVGKWLQGTVEPRRSTKYKIARALAVSISDLDQDLAPIEKSRANAALESADQFKKRAAATQYMASHRIPDLEGEPIERPSFGVSVIEIDDTRSRIEIGLVVPKIAVRSVWPSIEQMAADLIEKVSALDTARDRSQLRDALYDQALALRAKASGRRRAVKAVPEECASRPDAELGDRRRLIGQFYERCGGVRSVAERTGVSLSHLYTCKSRDWLNRTARIKYKLLAAEFGFYLPEEIFSRPQA